MGLADDHRPHPAGSHLRASDTDGRDAEDARTARTTSRVAIQVQRARRSRAASECVCVRSTGDLLDDDGAKQSHVDAVGHTVT